MSQTRHYTVTFPRSALRLASVAAAIRAATGLILVDIVQASALDGPTRLCSSVIHRGLVELSSHDETVAGLIETRVPPALADAEVPYDEQADGLAPRCFFGPGRGQTLASSDPRTGHIMPIAAFSDWCPSHLPTSVHDQATQRAALDMARVCRALSGGDPADAVASIRPGHPDVITLADRMVIQDTTRTLSDLSALGAGRGTPSPWCSSDVRLAHTIPGMHCRHIVTLPAPEAGVFALVLETDQDGVLLFELAVSPDDLCGGYLRHLVWIERRTTYDALGWVRSRIAAKIDDYCGAIRATLVA